VTSHGPGGTPGWLLRAIAGLLVLEAMHRIRCGPIPPSLGFIDTIRTRIGQAFWMER